MHAAAAGANFTASQLDQLQQLEVGLANLSSFGQNNPAAAQAATMQGAASA